MNRLQSLLANKHTSAAAMTYAIAVLLPGIAKIWFPEYGDKIDATAGHLREAAIGYGLLTAGDATQLGLVKKDVQEIKTGNTDQFLPTPSEPQIPK